MDPGDMGRCNDDENGWLWLEDELRDGLKLTAIPKAKTLMNIMDEHFPKAVAISYINNSIVVELKEVAFEERKERLNSLPHRIAEVDVGLRYHNGPILRPEVKDLANIDDTFDPTIVLSQVNDTLISVGIQIQRGQDTGFRMATHCWDSQDQAFYTLVLPRKS
jgi:hypothetical protein